MGINFPNTPVPGDIWPNPAVAGQGQYTWDGEKWTSGTVNTVGAVRYDTPQTLTQETPPSTAVSQRAQARMNVYAAPFDAMAYSGMQINGSIEVSQEVGTTGAALLVPGSKYGADGWVGDMGSASGTATVVQYALGPNRAFPYSIALYGSSTPPSAAGNDYLMLRHNIEGYRWSRLGFGASGAQPVTIAFWIASNAGGTCSLSLRNGPPGSTNRSYVTKLTLAGGLIWEYKTVTIPGDTLGTWVTNNTTAAFLTFCALSSATSSLNTGTTDVWQAGNFIAATGQTNLATGLGAGIFVTGVVVLPGIEAPSAARSPLIMRPFDQELVTCQRYYQKSHANAVKPGNAVSAGANTITLYSPGSGNFTQPYALAVRMRNIPNVLTYDNSGASGKSSYYISGWNNGAAPAIPNPVTEGSLLINISIASAVYLNFDWTADARL